MHLEVSLLAQKLARIVEDLSQDVESISLSLMQVNRSVLKMASKTCSTSELAPSLVADRSKEMSEKVVEVHTGFSDVLERVVVAVESLPHEVKNISLTLRDINDSMSSLMRKGDSITQDVSSWIDDGSNEAGSPTERAYRSRINKDRSVMSSPSTSSQDKKDIFWENLCGEASRPQDSVHEGSALMVKKCSSSNGESAKEEACSNTNELPSPDNMRSSCDTDASTLDAKNKRKIQHISKRPESSLSSIVVKPLPFSESLTEQVRAFEQSTSEGSSVPEREGKASLDNTIISEDSVLPSVTHNASVPLGDANIEPSVCSELNPCLVVETPVGGDLEEGSLKCPTCNKTFHQRDDLHSHLPCQCKKTLFKCRVCKKAFTLRRHLKSHMAKHRNENKKKCNESSSVPVPRSDTLMDNSFQCIQCGRLYPTASALKRHMSNHSRSFKCSSCGRGFPTKGELSRHNRIHTDERPYACTECNSRFKQKIHLSIHHHRVHEPREPRGIDLPSTSLCDQCGKSFTSTANLKIHIRTHTGEKPYKCNVCNKSFAHITSHVSHMRAHTGETPYICEECGKTFKSYSTFTYHKKTAHTGELPYKCSACGSTFVSNCGLRRHMLKHTNERPYACTKCESCFKQRSHLAAHLRLIHKMTNKS